MRIRPLGSGRITASAVYALICAPHYAASAMDGIALNAKDSFGATETTPVMLKPDQYIVVDTGDQIPDGNLSFMKKYFPNGGIRLIRCVGRQQGLMIQKGNPLGIHVFADIAKEGIRYVNRQKGSGTRILTDYLCKKDGLHTDTIYGYEREELTHTFVAAQIAAESADAGMGIYSAAQLYDLDFIPVCIEEYDLIIPDYAWETPMVQQMISTMKSDSFKEKLLALGGYTVEGAGEEIEM